MLWFNFILGLIFIFLCFKLIIIYYHAQKQRKIKIKPRIKLNHNIHIFFCFELKPRQIEEVTSKEKHCVPVQRVRVRVPFFLSFSLCFFFFYLLYSLLVVHTVSNII